VVSTLYSPDDARLLTNRHERWLLILAALFVLVNAVALSIVLTGRMAWPHLVVPLLWLFISLAAHLILGRYKPGRDPYLLPIVALLAGWGLILQDRLAPNFLWRQLVWFALGMVILVAVAIFPRNLNWLRHYRYTWLLAGLLLLGATLIFGVNPTGFGATLWLKVPFLNIYFQPSELLKLLLIIFLASYFDDREHLLWLRDAGRARSLAYLAPLGLMWGFCLVLLVWQRDLGSATLFFIAFITMLYLATGSRRYLVGGLVFLLAAGIIGYFAFDVVSLRVDTWWNPWPEADNRAFQIVQSIYAIAAGQIIGQGVGQGAAGFIPVVHSDFAFAAVAEEWGLIGSIGVVILVALLAGRGVRIAGRSSRAFRIYLAAGITILFAVQALLIMAGVTRLLPLTGVTLPFLSYGGSSMLMSSLMVGLLLYLSAPDEGIGR
jgi:peptidoglycan glycosyltransferase